VKRLKEFLRSHYEEEIWEMKTVYVPMAIDIVHPGHINIIKIAAGLGEVTVGLFTDDAIMSYKKPPYMNYEMRKTVVENIKGVSHVIPQTSRDYEPNLRAMKPDYMVHGKDWREGPLSKVRERAIEVMAEWGGEVVEPDYTEGISSSELKEKKTYVQGVLPSKPRNHMNAVIVSAIRVGGRNYAA